MARRSASYRKRGPDKRPFYRRWLGDAEHETKRRLRTRRGLTVLGTAAVPVSVGLTLARKRLGIHPAATMTVGCGVPLGAALALPHGRVRYCAIAAGYMYLFKLSWELPYDDPDKLRSRLQIDYPIRFDSWIGGGVPPGLRLQRALRPDPDSASAFDKLVAVVYGSWFLPHVLLAYMLIRDEEYVPRAGGRLAASYHLTTPFYWAVPTAPPWYASEKEGRMDGELRRVARIVVCDILDRPPPQEGETPGNPWGSMPSDHIASAAITARGLAELGHLYGAIGWVYVAAASFAVVYLGEHYVADVLVGLALAEVVHYGEPLALPISRVVAQALQ